MLIMAARVVAAVRFTNIIWILCLQKPGFHLLQLSSLPLLPHLPLPLRFSLSSILSPSQSLSSSLSPFLPLSHLFSFLLASLLPSSLSLLSRSLFIPFPILLLYLPFPLPSPSQLFSSYPPPHSIKMDLFLLDPVVFKL